MTTQVAPPAYLAAIVQAPALAVMTEDTAQATMIENAKRICDMIHRIMATTEPRPRLIVYPTQPLTTPNRKDRPVSIGVVAQELPGPIYARVVDVCRQYDCYFSASVQERVPQFPGIYFHTGFLLGPTGLVLRSPKAQAYPAHDAIALRDCYEAYIDAFGEAAVWPVVDTPLGRIGCLVESEILVPEVMRLLRHKGAEVIVHPSIEVIPGETFLGTHHPYSAANQNAAYANGVYVLTASPSRQIVPTEAGVEELWYGGASTIIGPDGQIGAMLSGTCEGVAIARIDIAHLRGVRERLARFTVPITKLYGQMQS